MGRSFDPGTDVRGNPVELQSIVICRIVNIESAFVIAWINDRVNGRIPVAEFKDSDIRPGVYFEAKIADFSHAGIPDLVKPEVIPSYEIRRYSYVRAEVTFVRGEMAILRINKYRFAKIPTGEVEGDGIAVGDIVEAEVIVPYDDEGYSLLGWGKIVEKGKAEKLPKAGSAASSKREKSKKDEIPAAKYVKKFDTGGMGYGKSESFEQPEKVSGSGTYNMYEWKPEQQNKQVQIPQQERVTPIRIHIYRKGEYMLFPFRGKLKLYTEKKLVAKWIPVTVNGKEKAVTVYVDQDDKRIYIPYDIYTQFEDALRNAPVLQFK